MFEKSNDGVDHILVSDDGSTELGRLLSLYEKRTFNADGHSFKSFIGYYLWKKRNLEYYKALFGRPTIKDVLMCGHDSLGGLNEMKSVIRDVLSVENNGVTKDLLCDTDLPLTYYEKFPVKNQENAFGWYTAILEQLRDEFKGG